MSVKTLLCREGRDTGLRLMGIIVAAFLLLTVVAIVFPASQIDWIMMLAVMPIVGLSAVRRLNDANKSMTLALVCVVPVLIFGLAIYFLVPFGALAGVFLFGLACGGYLAFLPAKNTINYVQGYHGPSMVQASMFGSVYHRQDPVMKGPVLPVDAADVQVSSTELTDNNVASSGSADPHFAETDKHQFSDDVLRGAQQTRSDHAKAQGAYQVDLSIEDDDNATSSFSASSARSHQTLYVDQDALQSGSITELAKSWLNVAKLHQQRLMLIGKITAAILAAAVVIYLAFALIRAFAGDDIAQSEPTDDITNEQHTSQRQMIKLPDGFWLVLEGDVLIVRWLGDRGDAQRLWSLATAIGDKSCADLEFNDSSRFRPITVDRLPDGATEARFTPLDKSAIVKNVALRGSFKFCGYEFNLTGSQAALMKRPQFNMLLSQ